MIALSARIGIAFGAFLAIAEVARNWGAWGFACAMFGGSFFTHLESLAQTGTGPIESFPLTATIGVLFAITILGLALAIAGSRREFADARRG